MKSQPVSVDFLHPTVVRTFNNWGYISFFGCMALLIVLMFFAIDSAKQTYAARQQRMPSSANPVQPAPVASAVPAVQQIVPVKGAYTNSHLGFSFQYSSIYQLLPNVVVRPTSTITTGIGLLSIESSEGYCPDECLGLQIIANKMTPAEFDYWRGGGIGFVGRTEYRVIQGQPIIIYTSDYPSDTPADSIRRISFYRKGFMIDINSVQAKFNGKSYQAIFDEILSSLKFF